ARKGAAGVCPINRPFKINCPIFQPPNGVMNSGDFVATPWAYAWPAFNLSAAPGSGQALWTSGTHPGITLQNDQSNGNNVTAYAVLVNSHHLVITIFNKTYAYSSTNGGNPSGTALTIPVNIKLATAPGQFLPTNIQRMALNSGGTAGDSTAMGCQLGGQHMLTSSS